MKFCETAKFAPGLFVPQKEDEIEDKTEDMPFKEVNNLNFSKNNKKKERRNRAPKKFIEREEESDLQTQNQVFYDISSEKKSKNSCSKMDNPDDTKATEKKQNKMLYDFNLDSEDQNNDPSPTSHQVLEEIPQTRRQQIASNFNRLQLLDWTMSSDLGEEEQQQPSVNDTQRKKDTFLQSCTQFPAPDWVNKPITIDMLFERLPPQTTAQCIVRRDKKNHEGITEYNIYFQSTLKHILTVKKEGMWQYGLYIRFCKGTSFTYQKIGSIQSNFLSNKFTLLRKECKDSDLTVCYETNLLGLKGPRKLHVYLPLEPLPFEYLNDAYEHKSFREKVEKCVSKSAKWNQKVKSYTLSFRGRALQSSIKNFVISDQNEDENKYFIIFGKAGPDIYNLDIESPFSLVQAISVAITSFERKLTCD